jgi:hypothetical protein
MLFWRLSIGAMAEVCFGVGVSCLLLRMPALRAPWKAAVTGQKLYLESFSLFLSLDGLVQVCCEGLS